MTAARRETIDRFALACRDDDRIEAAFLGGSLAARTADEYADLDLYVVVAEEAIDRFAAGSEGFVWQWGKPVFLETVKNFEGLSFDMACFILEDGVEGEMAFAPPSGMMRMHGGPHNVLVDKTGILSGIEFPRGEAPAEDKAQAARSHLAWAWRWLSVALKVLARGHLWTVQAVLPLIRSRCAAMLGALGRDAEAVLANTFVTLDQQALEKCLRAIADLLHEAGTEAAAKFGFEYPKSLELVVRRKLEISSAAVQNAGMDT